MSADNKGQEPTIDVVTEATEASPQTMEYIGAVALTEDQKTSRVITPAEAPREPLSGRQLPYFAR